MSSQEKLDGDWSRQKRHEGDMKKPYKMPERNEGPLNHLKPWRLVTLLDGVLCGDKAGERFCPLLNQKQE